MSIWIELGDGHEGTPFPPCYTHIFFRLSEPKGLGKVWLMEDAGPVLEGMVHSEEMCEILEKVAQAAFEMGRQMESSHPGQDIYYIWSEGDVVVRCSESEPE